MTARRRYFNITGPCFPELHYLLPPAGRLIGAQLDRYISDQLYWVLHAPRQTGKTTFLQSWMREINAGGEAIACYVSVERCQGLADHGIAIPAVIEAIRAQAADAGLPVPAAPTVAAASALDALLRDWAALVAPQPLVVLFDEVDVLEGPALTSFLRQLRGGFATRGIGRFPVSVALVGMRDLRDYLVRTKEGVPLNPGSPFNIKHGSATLGAFSIEDIRQLYGQHTSDSGQAFAEDVPATVHAWTCGQPWLVNALAEHVVYASGLPAGTTITAEHLAAARTALVASRAVHLDNLAERLKEPRVRRVLEPILTGSFDTILRVDDPDVQYAMDLGLVTYDGEFTVSNPMYREILVRTLSLGYQQMMPKPEFRWQTADGQLDATALMSEFQTCWRRHGEVWEERADYPEAFPHLLLMAFLQRVVNGGGQVEREYAAGRGRLDLLVGWAGAVHAIEVELVHERDGYEATRDEGLTQLARYADRLGAASRTLVIFDRRPASRALPWAQRLGSERHGEVLVIRA